jgi:N-acetylglucosaminyldiphosphoundecaprenol N-acetyl-beta-D-mannosaminyltransferase
MGADQMIDAGKRSVLGVLVDALDYDAATDRVVAAARARDHFAGTALAVHGVMTGVDDPAHNARLNAFDLVTPDGQPVRWGLNLLYHTHLPERVYGPELTARVVRRCAAEGLAIYLYGSSDETLDRLVPRLRQLAPGLRVVGAEASKFRPVRPGEEREIAHRIRASGARLVLVGLGCPRQEVFSFALRPLLDMPILAVGAAFEYHAGLRRYPPQWIQRRGLEWVWRLALEPRRLWRRYLVLNPRFAARLGAQLAHLWRPGGPAAVARTPADFYV